MEVVPEINKKISRKDDIFLRLPILISYICQGSHNHKDINRIKEELCERGIK